MKRSLPTVLLAAAALALTALASLAAAAAQAAPPATIAFPGSAAGQVERPLGTAVDQSSGDLYVADAENFRIDKFDSEGSFLLTWGFGVADNESAELQTCGPQASPPTLKCFVFPGAGSTSATGNIRPDSVAVDQSSHDVYVADSSKRRVTKFTPSGELLFLFGPDVTFSGPGNGGADEQQSITVKATGGTYTLSLTAPAEASVKNPKTETTAPIPYSATSAEVQTALEALAIVEAGDLSVSGGPGDATGSTPYTVSFTGGAFAHNDVAQMSADAAKLSGGSAAIATPVPGGGPEVCEPKAGDACKVASVSGDVLSAPKAAIVDPSNQHVWVGDNGRIVQFDSTGHHLSTAPIPGAATATNALALGPVSGDFYTLKASANEGQRVSFAGFANGDTFTIGNLPASCSAASTAPIEYVKTNSLPPNAFRDGVRNALDAKCGADSFEAQANAFEGFASATFQGALTAHNFTQLTCTKDTGAGSCSVSTLTNGAPGAVRKLEPSGSPVNTLTEVGALDATGSPQALVPDAAGDLYVGDNVGPYHFLKFNPAGEQTAQFGAGQVIMAPHGAGPSGNALAIDEAAGALYAASSRPTEESAVQRFALPEEGPLPDNPQAEDVLPTTATLRATLNPEGNATTYHFEYGSDESYGQETTTEALPGSGYESEEVSAVIEHLIPDTTYHFRLVASNECKSGEQCTIHSEDATFTTPPAVKVDAQWVDEVTAASATFKAELDPLGVPAEWRLEYGTSKSYGSATAFQTLGSGFGDVAVAMPITGLSPDTLYYYRFAAKDKRDGVQYVVNGPDQTLLTALGTLGFSLPDGRAWEQVTPLRKGGGRIVPPWLGLAPASEDGSALSFISVGPVSEAAGGRYPESAQSLARRGPEGWTSEDIEPPRETSQPADLSSEYRLFSPDLARAALEPRGLRAKQPGPLSAEASEWTPYLRESFLDPARWRPLVTGKMPFANVCPGVEFGGTEEEQLTRTEPTIHVLGGSPDLRQVILKTGVPLTCDAEGAKGALYEWSDGALELISKLPDGKAAGGAALGSIGTVGSGERSIDDAVSRGGRYAYWAGSETEPTALYLRDTAKEETIRLDEPQPHSIGGNDRPFFQGASVDGRRAFFTDTRHLTPDAGETGADLYACEIVEAGGKDKCSLRDLTPETADRESADVQGAVTAIGEAAEDLYFVANGALAPGGVAGNCAPVPSAAQRCNLYYAHREGGTWSTRLVAVLSGGDSHVWGPLSGSFSTANLAATASPDGRYLAFMSLLSLSGYDNRDAKSGEPDEEVFRYDSEADGGAGELACVSCNPSGARPRGAVGADGYQLPSDWLGLWTSRRVAATLPDPEATEAGVPAFYRPRAMLDNGRVLFNAFDGLVAADSNGTADAYEYEPWGAGAGSCTASSKGPALSQAQGGACVALLSAGTSERESAVIDSSATGDDVFIITASRLSALDEDPDYDIYDVRVGGTAAQREALAECLGEACQSPPPPPGAPTPPTAALAGDGNLKQPAPRPRCRKGQRKVRRNGRARCVKASHRHHQTRGHRRHGRAHR